MDIRKTLFRIHFLLIVLLVFSIPMTGQKTNDLNLQKTSKSISKVEYEGNKYVDIRDFFNPSSPTAGFQEAVDHLKPEGGTIFVSPGMYKIRKSIVLFSGIYIIGSGEHSVIERIDSCVQRPLLSEGRQGDKEIQVDDVNGFFKGGEITIASNTNKYWDCTNATIIDVKEKSLKLDRPLKKDYLPEDEAAVMNFFPAFTATRAENIRIENLTIDGKMKSGSNFGYHFVCSAIHFRDVYNLIIDKVIVRHFPADGFSVQGGGNASVTNCIAEYNLGNGFHPGTTLPVSTWTRNTGRYNGLDGLYFCFNVKYATVSENHFYCNHQNGIGGLGEGGQFGDQMNVVSGNFCFENSRSGIECTPGGNNIVVNNVCENNSRGEPGKWPGIYLKDTHSTIIQGNRCSETSTSSSDKKRSPGILLIGKCVNNVITGNILTGFSSGIAGDNLEKNTIVQNVEY
jgi:hypothetical protein